MSRINAALRQAIFLHRTGNINQAETLYRQVLASDPGNPDASQLLGVLILQSGRAKEAVLLIKQALARRPTDSQGLFNLAMASQGTGDISGAIDAFRKAIAFAPRMVEAHANLGMMFALAGRFADAVPCLREAVRLAPQSAQAWGGLGNALRESGGCTEAIECFRSALRIDAGFVPALFGLGLAFAQTRRDDEAEQAYREALRGAPGNSDIWSNLGTLHRLRGGLDAALACFDRVVALAPFQGIGHYNRGLVLADLGRWGEAEAAQREAIACGHDIADAHDSLGVALQNQGQLTDAIASYNRACSLNPRHAIAATNLGTAYLAQSRIIEALAAFQTALDTNPSLAATRSNLLMTLQYGSAQTPAMIYAAARGWEAAHARPASDRSGAFANSRDPDRRLRVGYLSADLRSHSCAWFLEPLLAAHDAAQVEVVCFFGARQGDAVTDRFKRIASRWHEIAALGDAELAALIANEGVDILVDCNGHTAGNRLTAMALKPAPVQVTWLGYPGTTGLSAIDYRLTDAIADPPDADAHSSESLFPLPSGFLCYLPPPDAPAVGSLPALRQGRVTFGSFNNPAKLDAPAIAAWSRIVAAVPGARLLLKARQFGDPGTRARFLERFAAASLDPVRIELLPSVSSLDAHLSCYGRVDLALDPFPYNGTTTTCEALWMGVPVVTLCGDRHAGRVGASLLTQVGLDQLIAEDIDGYVTKAVAMAFDIERLALIRAGLRGRMASSALTDAPGFARRVEAAYRTMWRRWCEVG